MPLGWSSDPLATPQDHSRFEEVPASMSKIAQQIEAVEWDFADVPPATGVHALHSYPAKFIPNLPATLIELLSEPGDLVIDPFAGGGTTGVEATRLGRRFFGSDANAFAVLLSNVKLRGITPQIRAALKRHLDRVSASDLRVAGHNAWKPDIPNLEKWYDPKVFDDLAGLRAELLKLRIEDARDIAMLALASAAARLSFQESETRYVSQPRAVADGAALSTYTAEVVRMLTALPRRQSGEVGVVRLGDAREADAYPGIEKGSVTAAITSPPYPNAYDYHLYHRFRLFWLGAGPKGLRDVEIGSHLKNQSDERPMDSYLADMGRVFDQVRRALALGGYFALVVGTGLHKGEIFDTATELSSMARAQGFEEVACVTRNLPSKRRSVTHAGRRLLEEQVLVLRAIDRADESPTRRAELVRISRPNYPLFPYEEELLKHEVRALTNGSQLVDGDLVTTNDPDSLRRLAFAHGIKIAAIEEPTWQKLCELPTPQGRPKNSTYGPHGIHRYKGKFYPQQAKSLINSSANHEGIILDPFGGSGTVAAEAILSGRSAISFDCNPVAVATAKAKVSILVRDPIEVSAYLSDLRTAVRQAALDPLGDHLSEFPACLRDEIQSWFPAKVLCRLNPILRSIRMENDEDLRNVGLVLVSDVIREVSQQEPKDLRIRRRGVPLLDAPVAELILDRVDRLVRRLEGYWSVRPSLPQVGTAAIVCGDSAGDDFQSVVEEPVAAVVSSPPYGTALPYIDTDRLSLAAVFSYSAPDRRDLERQLIGSRDINVSERKLWEDKIRSGAAELGLPDSTSSFLQALLESVAQDEGAGFRKQQTPAVLARYFVSMRRVLANVASCLAPGGDIWMVLGDSQSNICGRKWTIPTVDEVAAIGKLVGIDLNEKIPITVTREDVLHSRNTITRNKILHFRN